MRARAATIAALLGLILYGLLLASILLIGYGLVVLGTGSALGMISLFAGIVLLIIVLIVYSKLHKSWKKSVGR